jgi:hypothetical protein
VTAAADEPGRRSEGQETVVSAEEELLSRAYLAYNGQDVDGLLLNRIRPIFGEYYGDPETADDLTGAEKVPVGPRS